MKAEKAWVAVGHPANWERGLENGIWGIVPELAHHWQKIEKDDIVLFYCKAPISRFFGAGILRTKFRQTNPLWKEEIQENRVIWPYRFEFDVIHLIPFGGWKGEGISNRDYNLAVLGGLNPIRDFSKAMKVLEKLTSAVGVTAVPGEEFATIIYEIGKIQRMIVERQYPVDSSLLDVIWKRTVRSVPTFAFSIDLEGRFEVTIQTLKHAYDLWNSRPFLITDQSKFEEVNETASGLYHEFTSTLKVLSTLQVQELYNSKKNYYELEEKYGLR